MAALPMLLGIMLLCKHDFTKSITLKGRVGRQGGRRERDHPLVHSANAHDSQAQTRSSHGSQEPKYLGHPILFPRFIIRKLYWKQSSWDSV